MQRRLEFLGAFDYTLEYRKGSANGNADLLSRLSEPATDNDGSGSTSLTPVKHGGIYLIRACGLCNPSRGRGSSRGSCPFGPVQSLLRHRCCRDSLPLRELGLGYLSLQMPEGLPLSERRLRGQLLRSLFPRHLHCRALDVVVGVPPLGRALLLARGRAWGGPLLATPPILVFPNWNADKCVPLHWRGTLALGSSARRPMPHTGSTGAGFIAQPVRGVGVGFEEPHLRLMFLVELGFPRIFHISAHASHQGGLVL